MTNSSVPVASSTPPHTQDTAPEIRTGTLGNPDSVASAPQSTLPGNVVAPFQLLLTGLQEENKQLVSRIEKLEKPDIAQWPLWTSFGICGLGIVFFLVKGKELTIPVLFAATLVMILSINTALEFFKGKSKAGFKTALAIGQIAIILLTTWLSGIFAKL